jgi:hypothetical protein
MSIQLQSHHPLLPKSFAARVLMPIWLALCVGLLVFAYLQREVHDMPIAFFWLLVVLTFPIGLLTAAFVGAGMAWLYAKSGIPYVPFLDVLPSWAASVFMAYIQWVFVLPAIVRGVLRLGSKA